MPEIPRPSEWRCKDMVRVMNVALRANVGAGFRRPVSGRAESALLDGQGALCLFPRPPPEMRTGDYRGSEEG